jgi:serine/threonine protein kinase
MTSRLPNPFEGQKVSDEHSSLFGDEDPAEALLGRNIAGRYRIDSIIGRGGMGVVYGGTHLELDRDVAIKVLPGMFTRDAEVLKRFEREARTASKVAHKNIVTVFDYGRLESGEPYLVMERLSGRDLEQVMGDASRRMTPAAALDVLEPLADALDAMHAVKIVHRDIKPSNVFFSGDGQLKLVDFGLAAFRTPAAGERLTRTGSVVGTAEYMAPEAARGVLVDARGDVYSLAVVAYELLTGQLPFNGEPMQVLIDKVSSPAPRLSQAIGAPVAEAVEDVMARALDRKPENRQHTAGDFVRALRAAIQASPPMPSRPAPPLAPRPRSAPPRAATSLAPRRDARQRASGWIAGLALLLALGLGVGAVLFSAGEETVASSTPDPIVVPSTPAPVVAPVVATAPAVVEPPPTPEIPPAPATAADTTVAETTPVATIATPHPRGGRTPRAGHGAAPAATPTAATPTTGSTAAASATTTTATTPVAAVAERPSSGEGSADQRGAERAQALVREAQSALLRGEVARARELYREATGASPRNPAAWRGLGLASERMSLAPEAIEAYERYLRVAPSAADAEAIRARVAHLRGS